MDYRLITKSLLDSIDAEVIKFRQAGTHRPTVAVVIEHFETGQFLIVTGKNASLYGSRNPGIVKGGVHRGEHILDAGMREIVEETGVDPSQIKFKTYGGSYNVASLRAKGGFQQKRYFVFHAIYEGSPYITINSDELSGYFWTKLEDIEASLNDLRSARPDKFNVLVNIFSGIKKGKS